jgi:hypothetical protein
VCISITLIVIAQTVQGGAEEEGPAPGLGVYSSWLGGLPGWLSGAWWFEKRDMTQQEVQDMKARELGSGRLAMCALPYIPPS